MPTIKDILTKYHDKIDALDLELLIAAAIGKPREFVIAHPEYAINSPQVENLKLKIFRRMRGEPIAYILGHKEFFGLDFKVNRHTLIPRPETELLVEEVLKLNPGNATLVDVGTGSGNIIISLAKKLKARNKFMGIDISKKTLVLAKQNAQLHRVDKKIKFMKGDMLSPIINNLRVATGLRVIITANLPYLSKNIYSRVSRDIIKYEPKSALLSGKEGLAHYEKLLKHIKKLQKRCFMLHVSCFMEISPEQKNALQKMIKKHFPQAQTSFSKDLSGRWRLGQISLD